MATLDPTSMLGVTVSSDNAVQVIIALQQEVIRLNGALVMYNQEVSKEVQTVKSDVEMKKSSTDFEIASMLGDINGVKDAVKTLKEDVKDEIIKTNGMMSKMKEEVIEACSAGGIIDMSIQQSINMTFSALNTVINNCNGEMDSVKAKIQAIESAIASQRKSSVRVSRHKRPSDNVIRKVKVQRME
jgi:hypothetical protein